MRWHRRRPPQPVPPENVRAHYPDGRVVPVECVYVGVDPRGIHIWAAVSLVAFDERMRVTCDRLPAKTGVVIAAAEEVEW